MQRISGVTKWGNMCIKQQSINKRAVTHRQILEVANIVAMASVCTVHSVDMSTVNKQSTMKDYPSVILS